MVDAQAPGLATLIRYLSNLDYYTLGWEHRAWYVLTQLYLATEGFTHREQLAPKVQEDIKTVLGWTYNQEELKQQEGIEDVWSVLGKQESQEDRLTVIKYWLRGEKSERYALILQFVVSGQPRDSGFVPGTRIEAELVFYPGNYPLRAIVKSQQRTHNFQPPVGYHDLNEFEDAYASALAANPWIIQVPVVFSAMTPYLDHDTLLFLDQAHKVIPVAATPDDQWKLLALSGGRPIPVCGVVEHQKLYPLGAWASSNYHVL